MRKKLLSTENNTVHKIGDAISPRLKFIENFGELLSWEFHFFLVLC